MKPQLSRKWQTSRLLPAGLVSAILWCLLCATPHASESDDFVRRLQVAYLYNFTRFVDWPEGPGDRPFVIGLIGDPLIEPHLRKLEARTAHGRPIQVRRYQTPDAIAPSEILFVGHEVEDELDAVIEQTTERPTLLVGDTPGYVGRGVAIEFFLKPDIFREKSRLRFRIDPEAIRRHGLTVSAQLMDVAEVWK